MLCKIKDLSFDREGRQVLSLTVQGDIRDVVDNLAGVDVDVDIHRHRNRRSLSANAYAWVLIDKLAQATRLPKETIYKDVIRSIGGVSDVICVANKAVQAFRRGWESNGIGWQTDVLDSKIPGCTNIICYYGSSTYNTEQMSALVDLLIQDCKALGIEHMSPSQLERLTGYERR